MEFLIVSGLSGGGKSRAASYLEDIGYYTVDNLPAEMMVKFADFCAGSSGRYDRVALVYDVRSGEPTDILIETLERLKASGVNCRMLFLEADTPTINSTNLTAAPRVICLARTSARPAPNTAPTMMAV